MTNLEIINNMKLKRSVTNRPGSLQVHSLPCNWKWRWRWWRDMNHIIMLGRCVHSGLTLLRNEEWSYIDRIIDRIIDRYIDRYIQYSQPSKVEGAVTGSQQRGQEMIDGGGQGSRLSIMTGSAAEKGGVVSGRVAAWQVQYSISTKQVLYYCTVVVVVVLNSVQCSQCSQKSV